MTTQYNRFTDMLQTALVHETKKRDFQAPVAEMQMSRDGNMIVNGDHYELEYGAFSQMVKSIVEIPANEGQRQSKQTLVDYLWNNRDNGICQYAMQRHMDEHQDHKFLVRTYEDKLRAFLSPNYSVMNNAGVMMRITAILNHNDMVTDEFRVVESNVGRDEIRVKLILENYHDGQYGTGIYFSNSELGNGSVAFHPLVKRAVCDNSILAAENMALYHRGNIYDRLQLVEPDLINSIKYSADLLQQLHASRHKTLTVEQMDKLILALKDRYSLSDAFVERIQEGTEGQLSLFGIVNGITWAAKQMSDREQYEQIAGKFLTQYLN